jgi:uncharacterized protein YraI
VTIHRHFRIALVIAFAALLPVLAHAAAISVTAASVVRVEGDIEQRTAGGTITAGQVVRLSSGSVVAAVNDNATNAAAYGIALNGGGSGQPIIVQKTGDITIGGTVAVGKIYALGTSGGIIPVDDIAGSEFISIIGVGISATVIRLSIKAGGVAAAGAVTDVWTPNDEQLLALLRDAA